MRRGVSERLGSHGAAACARLNRSFVRSDVYAQLLRARMIGEARGVLKFDEIPRQKKRPQTRSFQLPPGGFSVRPQERRTDTVRQSGIDGLLRSGAGEPMPFVNPVSTAFCVQALAMWDDRSAELGPKCDVI